MVRHRMPSDIGGTRRGQPIDRRDPGPEPWHLKLDGVRRTLRSKGCWETDEGRRANEDLGPELYERLGYHERKLLATENLVVEKGLLDPEDVPPRPPGAPALARRPRTTGGNAEPADPPGATPAFEVGEVVRIRDAWPPGHTRTPGYVRGKRGRVVGVHGPYRNPESLAEGGSGLPAVWLCTVEFSQREVWEDYRGRDGDAVRADIYEHWIEPAEELT